MAPASSNFVFTFGLDASEGGVSPESAPRVIVAPAAGGRPWEFPVKTLQGLDGGRRVQCRQSRTSALFSPFHIRSAKVERALRSFGGLVSSVPWMKSPARRGVLLPIDTFPLLSVCEAEQHRNLQVYSISGETSDGTEDRRLSDFAAKLSIEPLTLHSRGSSTSPSSSFSFSSVRSASHISGKIFFYRPRGASQIARRLFRRGFHGGGEQRGDMNRFFCCTSGVPSFVYENHRSGMAPGYYRNHSFLSTARSFRSIAKRQRHTFSKRSALCRRLHPRRIAVGYGQGKESG